MTGDAPMRPPTPVQAAPRPNHWRDTERA